MKVSTVTIVMAILCNLSSYRCEEVDDAIAIAVGNSTAIAVNCKPSDAMCSKAPSKPGSSSGSNDKDKESKWKDELERALKEKYEGKKREDLDRAINALMSSIRKALAKSGLSGAMIAELNFALKILTKAYSNHDTSFKEAVYNEALNILIIVLRVGEESDKIETTTMSYSKWKEENEKRLEEKYEAKKREDLNRDINTLMSSIHEALKSGLCEPKIAELNYAMKILIKAGGNYDSSVKRAAYNEALGILTRVLRQ